MSMRVVVPVVLTGLLLTACADLGGPIDGQKRLSPTEMRFQDMEARLADLTRRLDAMNEALTDGGSGRINDDIRRLRGETEKLRYDLETAEKRSKDLYLDLDRRLLKLEGGGVISSDTVNSAVSAPSVSAAGAPVADAQEEASYLQAFDLLKGGRYDDAITGFRAMLQKWPQGRYADNAWYWMGEAYFVKRDYASAIESFKTVPQNFPGSPKAPDALLKLGMAYQESKQRDPAKAAYQKLIRDFPTSNAAGQARQRLEQP